MRERALGALRLTRSFLLLEDDHRIGWEADEDELAVSAHPHRAPLRARTPDRRPGRAAPERALCLSPTERGVRVDPPPARPAAPARGNNGCTQRHSRLSRP